jgi:phage terminase large subunit
MESRHEDNPTLYVGGLLTLAGADYIGKLDALTGVRYSRLRKGLWVAAEGLVYEDFDPAIHLHPQIVLPPKSWNRYWSVDFGFTNPTVIQFWAEDPDGRLYLYREIYRTKTLVEDHVKAAVLAMKTHNGMDDWPRDIITDHDAEDRATMERHLGHSTVAANKTVSEGIQAVQSRLKVQADGKPRLYLCRDAVVSRDPLLVDAAKPASTIEEITGYVWDTSGNKAVKETPLKLNDHGCDGARYLVAHVDLGARPRFRSFSR